MDFTTCAILTPALPPTSLGSGHPTGLCECTPSLASVSWNNVMWLGNLKSVSTPSQASVSWNNVLWLGHLTCVSTPSQASVSWNNTMWLGHLMCVSTPSQASNSWNNITWPGYLVCMYSKSPFSFLKQCHVIGCSCVCILQVMFQLSEIKACDWVILCVCTPSHISAFWNNVMWLGHLVCMHSKSCFSFLKKRSCDWVILRVTLQVMHVTGSPCVYARKVTLKVHKTMSCDWVILCVCMPSHTSVSWNNAMWLGHPLSVHPIPGFSFLKQGVAFQLKHTRNVLSQNSALMP